MLGCGHGADGPQGLARPLATVPCTRGWAEGLCQGPSPPTPQQALLEVFFVSTVMVGLAEIGDKTQIVALMLAARFPRPLPLIVGILCATLLNHGAAGLLGTFLGAALDGPWMQWALGASFIGVAIWALFPDRYEAKNENVRRFGAFVSSLIAFFLAEIGDKTQIATIGLA